MTTVLQLQDVRKTFARSGRRTTAVDGVDLTVGSGEIVGLIGESGSGKSTLARLAMMLLRPTDGVVTFEGEDLTRLSARALRARRSRIQIVFQEPSEALDPQQSIGQSISEPLDALRPKIPAAEKQRRVAEALEMVSLDPAMASRFPGQLSGGQQQRVGIARAIITRPSLIVLDEPTSSLDLSVRAGIITLLQRLQDELSIAYLFISHDLATVEYLADRLVVLYHGVVVETGRTADVIASPRHPYTRLLVDARLDVDPRIKPVQIQMSGGDLAAEQGCPFQMRCPRAQDDCRATGIPLTVLDEHSSVACLHPLPEVAALQ